jgi:hypothetical protein
VRAHGSRKLSASNDTTTTPAETKRLTKPMNVPPTGLKVKVSSSLA